MQNSTLIQDFVTVKPGEPFRLFPFGTIYKSGKRRDITPEYARTISLPHFRAPIKLGSHEDVTPAGGFITSLEVRSDGIYAVPEWNEKGLQAIENGSFRYNSPEILWSGGLENPSDGSAINAPLILGTALLHTPHLGEATALYEVEIIKENNMEENVTFPKSFFDKFIAPWLARDPEVKEVEVVKTIEPEDYAATKLERDELKAKIETQEAASLKAGRVEKFTAELKETKANVDIAELLADLPGDKAEQVMSQFKALSAQIDESNLLGEKGKEGGETEGDPKAAFNAIVLSIMAEKKIDNYNAAFEVAKASHADLFKQWAK